MKNVEVFAGERASRYDEFVEVWVPGYYQLVNLLSKIFQKNNVKDLLVAGCGTGNEIKILAESEADWHITGFDPSPEMIKQAKIKLREIANISVDQAVVNDLDESKKYDAATLLLVLHFLNDNGDKLALLKDLALRLKPQATLVVLDIAGKREQIKQNLSILKSLLPDNLDEEEVKFRMERMLNKIPYISEQRFSELCIEAGFEEPIRFFQSTVYIGWLLKRAY